MKFIKLQTDYLFARNVQDLVKYYHFQKIITKSYRTNKREQHYGNTYGTIDQLIINKMVMDNVKLKQRNIATAWIEYKKAFDSVLHDWIMETLKIHKFDPITTQFINKTMNNWKT